VYVAAFGLDEGESIGGLLAQGEPTAALAHLRTVEVTASHVAMTSHPDEVAALIQPAIDAVS
jgi:hypothetical protein